MKALAFRKVTLKGSDPHYIPTDVDLAVPKDSQVSLDRLHLLTYIPWHKHYLKYMPPEYRDFFNYVLPYLSARTTSVHTALSLSFVPELIKKIDPKADANIIYLALILHDCGWSQLHEVLIADSLDYSGVRYTPEAAEAKRLHTVHGGRLSTELLSNYDFKPALKPEEIQLISDISRYHERPFEYQVDGKTPSELIIVCEADRLWPYTRDNFWLDVIRKGVDPSEYIQNIATSTEEQFLTSTGYDICWNLINNRITEVAAYHTLLASTTKSSSLRHSHAR